MATSHTPPVRPPALRQRLFRQGMASYQSAHPLTPVCSPVLKAAILLLLRDAPRLNLFTSLARPVWSGWVSPQMIAWRLPDHLTEARFAPVSETERDHEAGNYVAEVMLDMAAQKLLEKRLCCPLRYNDDPDVRSRQDWEFRHPDDHGYCYWEPGRPVALTNAGDWGGLVNERHLKQLQDLLDETDSTIPPYVLARIERYQLHKTKRRVLLQ